MSQQKRMFKVLGIVPRGDNSEAKLWMRVGTGFLNRDNSINVRLDAFPRTFELQLRELTEEDFRRREPPRSEVPFSGPEVPRGHAPPAAESPPF